MLPCNIVIRKESGGRVFLAAWDLTDVHHIRRLGAVVTTYV